MNKKYWANLGVITFLAFIVPEIYSIFDGNEDTYTLTTAIITYINPWIALPVIIGGCSWIMWHFVTYYYNYYKKKKYI